MRIVWRVITLASRPHGRVGGSRPDSSAPRRNTSASATSASPHTTASSPIRKATEHGAARVGDEQDADHPVHHAAEHEQPAGRTRRRGRLPRSRQATEHQPDAEEPGEGAAAMPRPDDREERNRQGDEPQQDPGTLVPVPSAARRTRWSSGRRQRPAAGQDHQDEDRLVWPRHRHHAEGDADQATGSREVHVSVNQSLNIALSSDDG